jgi:hypothetical protein
MSRVLLLQLSALCIIPWQNYMAPFNHKRTWLQFDYESMKLKYLVSYFQVFEYLGCHWSVSSERSSQVFIFDSKSNMNPFWVFSWLIGGLIHERWNILILCLRMIYFYMWKFHVWESCQLTTVW